jgi:hypothetical protein
MLGDHGFEEAEVPPKAQTIDTVSFRKSWSRAQPRNRDKDLIATGEPSSIGSCDGPNDSVPRTGGTSNSNVPEDHGWDRTKGTPAAEGEQHGSVSTRDTSSSAKEDLRPDPATTLSAHI